VVYGPLVDTFTKPDREKLGLNLKTKLAILVKVYNLYEHFLQAYTHACQRNCADCCTCNLTMTTLEGYYLVENLILENKSGLLTKLNDSPQRRFRPELTFNRIASLYARGKDVPEEQSDPSWGKCPFLEKLECIYYQFRPFGCRCMISKRCCSEIGFAEMDPVVMTVNDVFMQFIEHLDTGGYSGNFTDVLYLMSNENYKHRYEKNGLRGQYGSLVSNIPIPVLMIPPEHRRKIEYILSSLNNFLIDKN
jgi:hypothetical protein